MGRTFSIDSCQTPSLTNNANSCNSCVCLCPATRRRRWCRQNRWLTPQPLCRIGPYPRKRSQPLPRCPLHGAMWGQRLLPYYPQRWYQLRCAAQLRRSRLKPCKPQCLPLRQVPLLRTRNGSHASPPWTGVPSTTWSAPVRPAPSAKPVSMPYSVPVTRAGPGSLSARHRARKKTAAAKLLWVAAVNSSTTCSAPWA